MTDTATDTTTPPATAAPAPPVKREPPPGATAITLLDGQEYYCREMTVGDPDDLVEQLCNYIALERAWTEALASQDPEALTKATRELHQSGRAVAARLLAQHHPDLSEAEIGRLVGRTAAAQIVAVGLGLTVEAVGVVAGP